MARPLHPRRGRHDQSARTPGRAPNSVRRTTTIDTFRFDGPSGPATVVAAGRDLLTDRHGRSGALDVHEFELTLAPLGPVIASTRDRDALGALVGVSIGGGFRRVLHRLVPREDRASLRYRLLDDLPGAVLVGNLPLLHADAYPVKPLELLVLTDVCRGWADGGSQHVDIAAGLLPTPTGPVPNDISVADDPLAWHDTAARGHDFMRRCRRLDVVADGAELALDAHFRDVFVPVVGEGEVIHEYSLTARADAASMVLTAIEVRAHALPWQECNTVPATAAHLLGATLGELETTVRTELAGTAGCTHLNDTFRGLDAVPLLAHTLEVPR